MFFRLKDFKFKDKRVLLRVDFNLPLMNNRITNDSRIRKELPTIKHILKQKPSQLIIISHLGRPKGEFIPELSLKIVSERLKELLEEDIDFVTNPKISNIASLPESKIIMLENIQFDPGEMENSQDFARFLSNFADFFVLDAFGQAHREYASLCSIQKFIPSCAGLLIEKEFENLYENMKNPKRPFVAIIGGAKQDKIKVINSLVHKVDKLIIGGVLANTFLKAKGVDIDVSKYSEETLNYAKDLLKKYPDMIALPVDFILADRFSEDANTRVAGMNDEHHGWMIMDIGPYTISGYKQILEKAKTVVWAGPIGVFEYEKFRRGTWDIANFLAKKKITKIIGGGDSAAAIEMFQLEDKMTHVSTGGGASLELLAGNKLVAIKALEENFERFK